MQWPFIFCFFLIGAICVFVGLRKSTFQAAIVLPRHFCTQCGWTTEQVVSCQFEDGQDMIVAPLCFDCTIAHDAVPVKTSPAAKVFQEVCA